MPEERLDPEAEDDKARHAWAWDVDDFDTPNSLVDVLVIVGGKTRWRPTVMRQLVDELQFPRKVAEVYFPDKEAGKVRLKQIPFEYLRPSREVDPAVVEWFRFMGTPEMYQEHDEDSPGGIRFIFSGLDGEEIGPDVIRATFEEKQETAVELWEKWNEVYQLGYDAGVDSNPVVLEQKFEPGVWFN
jgi:hypothetical protein